MNTDKNIEILPEDMIKLTNDQENLIELAFRKEIPPEDADFIENINKNIQNRGSQQDGDSLILLTNYFMKKYGTDFGMIYLGAIMGGEEKYQETIQLIEKSNAIERIKNSKIN